MSAAAPLSPGFVGEVLTRTPLAAVIGRTVRLTRSGREWKACCPFHAEKTPSFYVYPDHFHCFGCGAHGDAISYLRQRDGLTFREAVEQLAQDAGLPLPDTSPPASEQQAADRQARVVARDAEYARQAAERDAEAAREIAADVTKARAYIGSLPPYFGTLGERNLHELRDVPRVPTWSDAIRYDDARRCLVYVATTAGGIVQGGQQVLLERDGRNRRRLNRRGSLKLTIGHPRAGNAVVRLAGDASWAVAIGEGVENTAVVAGAMGIAGQAALGPFTTIEPPAGVLTIAVLDGDAPGSAAATAQATWISRWCGQGRHIVTVSARDWSGQKFDFADLVAAEGIDAVHRRVLAAVRGQHGLAPAEPPFPLPTATMPEVYAALARDAGAFFSEPEPASIGKQSREALKGRPLNPVTIRTKKRRPPVVLRRDEPGSGKTTTFVLFGGAMVLRRKESGLPHVIVHLVPEHATLPPQLLAEYHRLGLKVAHLKGRGDPRNRKPGKDLCEDLDAVADALRIGASPAEAACGTLAGPHCKLFEVCAYQKQLAALSDADVIMAASTFMFQQLPQAARQNAWCVIVEEGFADAGDVHTRLPLDTFRQAALERAPVLADGAPDQGATDELALLQRKHLEDCDASPDGYLASSRLSNAETKRARHLTGRRKMDAGIVPGMDPERRREIAGEAAINGQVYGLNAVWRALRGRSQLALPGIAGRGAGRVELSSDDRRSGTQRFVLTHGQRRVAKWLKRLPIVILSGSMHLADVRRFFPHATEQHTPHASAPHAETELILGAWGTQGLAANKRKRSQLRDYLAFRGQGHGDIGIVAPLAILDTFTGMPGATVLHHGANAGSNAMVDAGMVASIGGPFARPADIARTAAARTGEPVPHARAVRSTASVLMTDGSGLEIPVLRYAHPAAQAVHLGIYNAAINQAIMRARPQLRTAVNPVLSLIFANMAPDRPVDRILFWRDIPHRLLHMVVRDCVTFNATEMARLYPDEFPTVKAAERARDQWGRDYPAFLLATLKDDPRAWSSVEFQPRGQGFKPQRQYCPTEALAPTIAAIEAGFDLVAEPAVSLFKPAREDLPIGFNGPMKPEGTSSPAPDLMAAGLLAGYLASRAMDARRPDHPPDG